LVVSLTLSPRSLQVDENDSTQDKLAKAVAQHFGIKYGFHGGIAALVAQFSIMDFSEAIEDANEHVSEEGGGYCTRGTRSADVP
jgi:protein tyrosine phosphatase (PTP) superfamily phosphohydrolase (DUF442 family)